jgi:hypothetical protein
VGDFVLLRRWTIKVLKNWSFVFAPGQPTRFDRFVLPDSKEKYVRGQVYNDSTREDGRWICTSMYVSEDENGVITTLSGSEYKLDGMNLEYRDFLTGDGDVCQRNY